MSNTPSFIRRNIKPSYDSQFLRRIAEKHYLTGPSAYTPEGERLMEIADKIDMVTGEPPRSDPADAQTFFDELRNISEEIKRERLDNTTNL
jgi:hypothetical protein